MEIDPVVADTHRIGERFGEHGAGRAEGATCRSHTVNSRGSAATPDVGILGETVLGAGDVRASRDAVFWTVLLGGHQLVVDEEMASGADPTGLDPNHTPTGIRARQKATASIILGDTAGSSFFV
jgi:hypothetical protein